MDDRHTTRKHSEARGSDFLQQQILAKESKKKEPVFAAILGFLFPLFGFLYVGRPMMGLLFLVIGICSLIFPPLLLLVGLVAGYQCYQIADQMNLIALKTALGRNHD